MLIEGLSVVPDFYNGTAKISWNVSGQTSGSISFQAYVTKTGLMDDSQLLSTVTDQTFMEPEVPILRHYERTFYIIIKGIDSSGSEYFSSPLPTNRNRDPQNTLRLYQKKIEKDEMKVMRVYLGIPIELRRRKEMGQRCQECYDSVTMETISSHCPACFNTGFVGGYTTPYASMGRFFQENAVEQHTSQGIGEIVKGTWRVPSFPELSKGDILIETVSNNRWTVERCTKGKISSNEVDMQTLQCSLISKHSIEYEL